MALQRLMNVKNNFEVLSALIVLLWHLQIITKRESLKVVHDWSAKNAVQPYLNGSVISTEVLAEPFGRSSAIIGQIFDLIFNLIFGQNDPTYYHCRNLVPWDHFGSRQDVKNTPDPSPPTWAGHNTPNFSPQSNINPMIVTTDPPQTQPTLALQWAKKKISKIGMALPQTLGDVRQWRCFVKTISTESMNTSTWQSCHEWYFYKVDKTNTEKMPNSKVWTLLETLSCG